MTTMKTVILSQSVVLLTVLVVFGTAAVFASVSALVSGRWIHVFRYRPEVTGNDERHDGNSSSDERSRDVCCRKDGGKLMIHDAVKEGNVDPPLPSDEGGVVSFEGAIPGAEDAFGGLWTLCLVHRCSEDGSFSACQRCSVVNDAVFKRRLRCHVSRAILAITGDASLTYETFVVSVAILVCAVTLEILGVVQRNLFFVLASFCFTTAGLLQLLGLFSYATVVNEEMKWTSSEHSDHSIGYSYDTGFVVAIFAFLATNASAILAAYSYRWRQTGKWSTPPEKISAAIMLPLDS